MTNSTILSTTNSLTVENMYSTPMVESIPSMIAKIGVDNFCDFNKKNGYFMLRLMNLNTLQKDNILKYIGSYAQYNGDSSIITPNAISPSYTDDNNYTDEFGRTIVSDELNGENTTKQISKRASSGGQLNYTNHNELYQTTENLYPDEEDTGTFANKWKVTNRNSILKKTKDLFKRHKINTVISRFHTIDSPESIGDAKTVYGLSHGKNLLTKSAESGTSYSVNGYNNPYCRVWTHHHQYDNLSKLIRPFVENEDGKPLMDIHNWKQFKIKGDTNDTANNGDVEKSDAWGWKSDNIGWKHSVLGKNGFVNITPKYQGGGKSNIHTKQCMFSLENLAWRDYDPYSFETALSWEQRGPMGGRIMWFPPYGISFNETTTARWQNNTFIGRGEDVYSYVNTVRSGTLNFMLVVDHPSIIDYVSWDESNQNKVSDTDLLRFFSGCDGVALKERKSQALSNNNGNSFMDLMNNQTHLYRDNNSEYEGMFAMAKPTPLTDEYIQVQPERIAVKENERPPEPVEPTIDPEPPIEITFYVFYPNNYSGYYDKPNGETNVEAIPYLLYGNGAQMQLNTNTSESRNKPTVDLGLSFKINNKEISVGNGYEMSKDSVMLNNGNDNYIVGTQPLWMYNKNKTYIPLNNKKWYYRIDGRYENETMTSSLKGSPNRFINCFDQTLAVQSNYQNTRSLNLNSQANQVKKLFTDEKDNENLFSLAEIAFVLCGNETNKRNISKNVPEIDENNENVKKLEKYFGDDSEYEIISINCTGYSNSHGDNPNQSLNNKRNNALAENRAKTVIEWFKNTNSKYSDIDSKVTINSIPSHSVADKDKKDVSGDTSKQWRSAKCVITIQGTQTKPLAETNQEVDEGTEWQQFTGFSPLGEPENGIQYYRYELETRPDKKGVRWYYDVDKQEMVMDTKSIIYTRAQMSTMIENAEKGNNRDNKYRYDQEYHFFKVLQQKDPIVFDSLMKKIQYFDPAFHSMTPEGFNARLTFLQQCTRQGNTISASNHQGKSANNLAFGRPPFCMLRLGDFFNQMIIIENMSINYDPLVWDLNSEGIGVQPLLANISLSFKFIGGADMTGPIRRLQNAMTFNYYANTRLYDNRADRVEYNWDEKESGAVNHDEEDGAYYHSVNKQN